MAAYSTAVPLSTQAGSAAGKPASASDEQEGAAPRQRADDGVVRGRGGVALTWQF